MSTKPPDAPSKLDFEGAQSHNEGVSEKILQIDALAFGGEGVGRLEGKVVFVPFTVPGDRVRVRILSDHGKYERAELVEILEKSSDRTEASCPVYGQCGGCQWQHLSYDAQLRWKTEILAETLKRVGRIAGANVLPIVPAPNPWYYRHRIQLKVDEQGVVGFHAFKSHTVVPFSECRIADPALNQKLVELKAAGKHPPGGFELARNGEGGVHVSGEDKHEKVFSQVNAEQNHRLIETVMTFSFGNADKAFTKKKIAVELYAGSGNFSFPLSDRVGKIYCVEESREAVRQAEGLMQERAIENMTWIAGTAEWGLQKVHRNQVVPDLLVLDPPRRGAKEILDLVCVVKPRVIVYVSCDPVTLARDMCILLKRYYRLEQVQPIDMFPQTYHIESISRLVLK